MGHRAVVQQLFENGADIETKSSSGETPLLWAAERGHKAVVQLQQRGPTQVMFSDYYSTFNGSLEFPKDLSTVVKYILLHSSPFHLQLLIWEKLLNVICHEYRES